MYVMSFYRIWNIVIYHLVFWWYLMMWSNRLMAKRQINLSKAKSDDEKLNKNIRNEQYRDFACSHEPYYYLDLHELNFPDRDERGCGLVNMTVHEWYVIVTYINLVFYLIWFYLIFTCLFIIWNFIFLTKKSTSLNYIRKVLL